MSLSGGWYGVDLDGTLALYDGWHGVDHVGEPIQPMLQLVKDLIASGNEVRIFTARAGTPECIPYIQDWTEKHGLGRLEVTNRKDYGLIRLFDDRAVQVEFNTGRIIGDV